MLLFNKKMKLFMGERYGEPGIWQFPQGGAEPELSLEENVYKELEEEAGLDRDLIEIEMRFKSTHEYEFRKIPRYAKGHWRGQSQTFWLVRFLGKNSDIALDNHHQEFSSWRWCTVEEVREIAEPKRLPGYEGPLKEFEAFIRKSSVKKPGEKSKAMTRSKGDKKAAKKAAKKARKKK
jgi:putative (di)nucleoside polyphosphate hydrolase